MSALTVETLVVPGAVLAASLLGSTHCALMCGPLSLAIARSSGARVRYHLGRLVSYLALGALAGYAGRALVDAPARPLLGLVSLGFMAALLLAAAARLWSGQPPHFQALPRSWSNAILSRGMRSALTAGLLSALLPCGWLQTFVLAAATTHNPRAGALLLGVFWLGTVPALLSLPVLTRPLMRFRGKASLRLASALLLALGAGALSIQAYGLIDQGSCHHRLSEKDRTP